MATAAFTTDELNDLTTAVARLENLLSVTDCTVSIGDNNTKQGKSSFSLLLVLLERARIAHEAEEIEVHLSGKALTIDDFARVEGYSMVLYVANPHNHKSRRRNQ